VVSDGTCTGSDTVFVDLYPEVLADAGTDTTISEGESVILTPSGGIVYEWSPDDYLSCTLCENPISTPQTSITYNVLVTDANGCSKTDSVVITVKGENDCGEIFIPTAFTPNNDGNNDDFKVLGNCIATIHLEVYDRWGGIVFKSDDPIESWKGDKDGSQLNGGSYTYIYIGTLTDGTPISGDGKVNMIK
jgi:gliding motility-associated-like protein